jgi:NAD(P)-dependent dehydrogenase (short-subunit alcohol dehydrogenase family)
VLDARRVSPGVWRSARQCVAADGWRAYIAAVLRDFVCEEFVDDQSDDERRRPTAAARLDTAALSDMAQAAQRRFGRARYHVASLAATNRLSHCQLAHCCNSRLLSTPGAGLKFCAYRSMLRCRETDHSWQWLGDAE